MRTLFAVLLSVACLVAQDHETKFTVQKIDAAKIEKLSKAESDFNAAMKVLIEAQTAVAKAQSIRDIAVYAIKQDGKLFEGECQYTSQPSNGSYVIPSPKKWRRAEIHADYLLISEGEASCIGSGSFLTNVGSGSGFTITNGN